MDPLLSLPKCLRTPPWELTTACPVLQRLLISTVILAGGISPAFGPIFHAGSPSAIQKCHLVLRVLVEVATEATGGPEVAAGHGHHYGPVFIVGHLQPKIRLQDGPTLALGDLDLPCLQGGWWVGEFAVDLGGERRRRSQWMVALLRGHNSPPKSYGYDQKEELISGGNN